MVYRIDFAVERDPHKGGSYRRRADDALAVMGALEVSQLPLGAMFIFYFLACEKIARVMVALTTRYDHKPKFRGINTSWQNVASACEALGCNLTQDEVKAIFDPKTTGTALQLRNQLFHDFGPTHLSNVVAGARTLNPLMGRFLLCHRDIVRHLESG